MLERYFDGVDYIYRFDEKVIVYPESVDVIENLYAENIPLFTHSYTPKLGDVVVDIGAGNGYEIQEFSRLVGETGRVIAIEADPNCFRRLQKTVKLAKLRNVDCVNSAVSDGIRDLFLVDNHPAGVSNFLQTEKLVNSMPIRTTPTSSILESLNVGQVDLLKMNIEGHEYQALLGLGDLIANCLHLVISCHDFMGIPSMKTRDAVIGFLESKDFCWASLNEPVWEWERDYIYATQSKFISKMLSESLNAKYSLYDSYKEKLSLVQSENVELKRDLVGAKNSQLALSKEIQELKQQISALTSSKLSREIKAFFTTLIKWVGYRFTRLKTYLWKSGAN